MLRLADFLAGKEKIAVVGLGYVGLPLTVALAEHFQVLGFDISQARVDELRHGRDRTGEVSSKDLLDANVLYSAEPEVLNQAKLIIVAVPTPIDANHRPALGSIQAATATVGRNMTPGTVVVYESTVFPGLTEDLCLPLLEEKSGLRCGRDFWVGYSPERINPGDKENTLQNIVKVVAGQDPETTEFLAAVYATVVRAGIHKAPSIKVAEAAKVIENTQRDLNIALMNELALIFERMGIDTLDVLEAAGTKWNFLPFKPGLVGGHCIGVDPYYLTFKAEALAYHPQVILAGRRINDSMGQFVAQKVVKNIIQVGNGVHGAKVGVLGLTFKENVPDLRNTRVIDIISELQSFCVQVLIHDPLVHPLEVREAFGLELTPWGQMKDLDAVIVAVPHNWYKEKTAKEILSRLHSPEKAVFADIKGIFRAGSEDIRNRGTMYWRL
ncbi:MAG: nucleotide sugar dehydrogenase [Desulfovermiculus sp.]|nr:nucleotide sugar dehydrogenase [Desulfovermiculus sp.]